MKAIVTIGISGSGKSTYAKVTGYNEFNRDTLRRKLMNIPKNVNLWSVYEFDKEIEEKINKEFLRFVKDNRYKHENIIISDTNINPNNRQFITKILSKHGFIITEKLFNVPLNVCIERNLKRVDVLPESVLYEQFYKLSKQYLLDILPNNYPKLVVCDIDGTISNTPQNCDNYRLCEVIPEIKDLLYTYIDTGYYPIFWTGRNAQYYNDTRVWIETKIGIKSPVLLMRPTKDRQKNNLLKSKLFEKFILRYNAECVIIDDSREVIDTLTSMYKLNGVLV